jgi:TPP-dependent pyruvate/acetoin dehydrogenase alpha subunit
VAARAAGYGIPGATVDGQDVEAVRTVVSEAIARARRGEGPTLIEALTTRRRGHWAGQNVIDPDSQTTGRADPLDLFAGRLIARGQLIPPQRDEVHRNVAADIAAAVERAKASADAGEAGLGVDDVYA